jgi:hypothetical protein
VSYSHQPWTYPTAPFNSMHIHNMDIMIMAISSDIDPRNYKLSQRTLFTSSGPKMYSAAQIAIPTSRMDDVVSAREGSKLARSYMGGNIMGKVSIATN